MDEIVSDTVNYISNVDESILHKYIDESHKRYNPMISYKEEYVKTRDMYFCIKQSFDNYRSVDGQLKYMAIFRLLDTIIENTKGNEDECYHIFRKLGIYGLPPNSELLFTIQNIIKNFSIKYIVDLGAGVGLWSCIIYTFLKYNDERCDDIVEIIAIDKYECRDNIAINRELEYYPIFVPDDIEDFIGKLTRSILLLIYPQYEDIGYYRTVENYNGIFIVYYGFNYMNKNEIHVTDDASYDFFVFLKKKFEIIKTFDPIVNLHDGQNDLNDIIYILKRIM